MISNSDQPGNGQTLSWREGDMPYSEAFGDQFYCKTDGRLECDHVFIDGNGLKERFQSDRVLTIGELGFGTGLNLCETWRQWRQLRGPNGQLHFVSFELYPMKANEIDRALHHWPEIAGERDRLVDLWQAEPTGQVHLALDQQTTATIVCGDAFSNLKSSDHCFDAWYLDGFAPSRNPAMWSLELMQALFEKTKANGTFATYAAAGFVRRNLQASGFTVEKRKGFAGKREMLCGRKDSP